MSKQYEALTRLIPEMEKDIYGEWNFEKKGEGTKENPYTMPHVSFSPAVYSLLSELAQIEREHPEYEFRKYGEYLIGKGYIKKIAGAFPINDLKSVSVELLNDEDILMMIYAVQRADRFCEGILLGFLKDGTILKWLRRLLEFDCLDIDIEIKNASIDK